MSEKDKVTPAKGSAAEKTPPAPQQESETPLPKNGVMVDREQLAKILRDNEEFRMKIGQLESNAVSTQQGGPVILRTGKKELLIPVRRWQDKYVVGWQNVGKPTRPQYVYSEYNPTTRESTEYINILLEGDNKPLKVAYVDFFREAEKVFLKLKQKIEEEPEVIVQGMTRKKDFVDNGYGMFETTIQVPMEVITPRYSYVLTTEDGSEITIKDTFIG